MKKTTIIERTREAIRRNGPEGLYMSQLREILGKKAKHLASVIDTLKKAGEITVPIKGLYVFNENHSVLPVTHSKVSTSGLCESEEKHEI